MTNVYRYQPNKVAFALSHRSRLLQCAAASAAAWAMLPSAAHAAIPPECDEEINPNIITCVVPAPDTVDQIDVTQDNTSIIVGDADTPTTVSVDSGPAIMLTGDGAQTVAVGDGSTVTALNDQGIFLTGSGTLSVLTGENSLVASANGPGTGDAILVVATGDVNVVAEGDLLGFSDAILATNDGAGSISIVASGQTVSLNNAGIAVLNGPTGNDVTINTVGGSVSGPSVGITATNAGSGVLSITTSDVSSTNGGNIGIRASNEGSDLLIDTTAGTVDASTHGIVAANLGTGDTRIATADVFAFERDAIEVETGQDTDFLTIDTTAGEISGGEFGLNVDHDGAGIAIIQTADVTGEREDGINIFGSGTSILLNTTLGSVSGGVNGIVVENQGGPGVTTVRTANVVGETGLGIFARNFSNPLRIDTTEADLVEGRISGIVAEKFGDGDLEISTGGRVVGIERNGINALVSGSNTVVDTSVSSVLGGENGVRIVSSGTGSISLTTGDVVGLDVFGLDISAIDDIGDVVVNSTAGSIEGGLAGIAADHFGVGSLSISTGNVTSSNGVGISTQSAGLDQKIDTTAGVVQGQTNGINAAHNGSGTLLISTADVTGIMGTGIFAASGQVTTDQMIDSTLGTVSGGLHGIDAMHDGSGRLTIRTADVTGEMGDGIVAMSGSASGLVVIDTSEGAISAGMNGINVFNDGSDALMIRTADVTGLTGDGIIATGGLNSVATTVDTTLGAVTAGGNGIFLTHGGSGGASVTTADVTANAGFGIGALSGGTNLSIDSSAGAVSSDLIAITAANLGNGLLSIVTGDVTSASELAIGAENLGTDLTINTVAGSVEGATDGISAMHDGSGALLIETAQVVAFDGTAIFATTGQDSTTALIDSTAGLVAGQNNGVSLVHGGSGDSAINTGDVLAAQGAGVSAFNSGANLHINTSAGEVFGVQIGIGANNAGSGDLAIVTGTVTGETGAGIFALNEGAGLFIDSSAGAVRGGTDGIFAQNSGSAGLQLIAADVVGDTANGVFVASDVSTTGAIVDTTAGTVMGAESGLLVQHLGSGSVSVSTADVTGANETGVGVFSVASDISLDTQAGSVSGQNIGIEILNQDDGSIDLVTGDVSSATGFGILAENNGTSLAIDSRGGAVTGATNGIEATNNGSGSVSIVTSDVTGNGSIGINLENNGLLAFIDTSAGTLTGSNEAIIARNNSGSLTVITGDLNGLASSALIASNNAGSSSLTIDTSAGNVVAANTGISADNDGSGALSITTSDVTSVSGLGIGASNSAAGTSLNIDTSAGTVSSDFAGIFATNDGAGDLTVTTGSVISATADAVRAINNGNGALVVNTSQGTVSAGDDGIFVDQNGPGSVTVTSGDVSAASQGIWVRTDGDQVTVNNNGIVTAGEFAVLVTASIPGTTTINNDGTLIGAVNLSQMDDEFSNNGVFAATADSFFDEGQDVLFNNGRLQVGGMIAFNGLELLNNSGTISLADGNFADSLNLAGDFLGSGGRLDLDVDLSGASPSDRLIINGAATGNTEIGLALDNQSPGIGNSILLVDAGAGTSTDAFILAGGDVVSSGFVTVGLLFDASNDDFLLQSTVSPAVFRTLKIGEGAQSAWYRSADAWSAHVDGKRHGDHEAQTPLWLQVYGSTSDRDDGFAFASNNVQQDIVLDYSQDFFGFQTGAEFGPGTAGEGSFFGVTAGYLTSDLGFDGLADDVRFENFNLGVYAGLNKGGFFAQGLAKYDFINADIDGSSAGYSAETDGGSIGLRAKAGYRWDIGKFFLEPSAGLDFQSTDLDEFGALNAEFDLHDLNGFRGTAGLRLGGETGLKGGGKLTYYASANAVHEFAGEGEITFSLSQASVDFVNNPIDTYARIDLGMNVATSGGVTGFIEGNADLSGDYSSYGGRAGLRIKF